MESEPHLSVDLDRAAGALVGLAAGDALGAGYETTTPAPDTPIEMIGGGWAVSRPVSGPTTRRRQSRSHA